MDIKKIKPDFAAFSNGGPAILKAVEPEHPYKDGKRVQTEVVGRKYTVVFPENGYETLVVKVLNPIDSMSPLLEKATATHPVYVEFDGFEAGFYNARNREGVWSPVVFAKATGIRVADLSAIDFD